MPYGASSPRRRRRWTTRSVASAASTASTSSGSSRDGAVALARQARVLVRAQQRRAHASLSPPRQLGGRGAGQDSCSPRGEQRGAQLGPRLGSGRGDPALRPPPPGGRAAQPRRPQGPAHWRVQTRLVTSPGRVARPGVDLHTVINGAARRDRRADRRARRRAPARGALRPAVPDLAQCLPADQHRDGRALYGIAAEFAGLEGRERLFDLFCGIGTIGLSLARSAGEVWGLESVADAVADAEHNAKLNEIANARFLTGDARLGIRPLIERAGRADVVVVDPPRAGLSSRSSADCSRSRRRGSSTSPATRRRSPRTRPRWSRRLYPAPREAGRHVPQTPHVECVAVLEQ